MWHGRPACDGFDFVKPIDTGETPAPLSSPIFPIVSDTPQYTIAPMRILLFLLASTSSLLSANWPAWRGANGDGVTSETDLPLQWSATEGVRWKIALPERGNSTPVVWGDRIFLTQNVGTRRTLMCLDRKDGKTLWQAGPEWKEKELTHGTNPFCSA